MCDLITLHAHICFYLRTTSTGNQKKKKKTFVRAQPFSLKTELLLQLSDTLL